VDRVPAAHKPGETLHPGVEPLLDRLGVLEDVLAARFLRHSGYWVEKENQRQFISYSANPGESWYGFQALRNEFDNILMRGAVRQGVTLLQTGAAIHPVLREGRLSGVQFGDTGIRSKFTIDAAGGRHWLARRLGLSIHRASPRFLALYGYNKAAIGGNGLEPVFSWQTAGWSWVAPLAPDRHAFVQLNVNDPYTLMDSQAPLSVKSADVTWRVVPENAGSGYFLAGDAACVLDPAASHGVLKAIMSGILAADLIFKVFRGEISEMLARYHYRTWMCQWFRRDAGRLRELYIGAIPRVSWAQ
jgi:flavin-dependent dehydrogenase